MGYLTFLFVTHQRLRALNRKFLNRNYATDVLAFAGKGLYPLVPKKQLIGDIIISVDAAKENAKRFETSFEYEIVLYMIHGILHLLGFNDHNQRDIKRMRSEEKRLFKCLEGKFRNIIDRQ